MRRLVLVLLASALAVAAVDAVHADSLQVAPKKTQKYNKSIYNDTYPTLHGRSYSGNSLPDPGSDNRYYSDTLNPTSIQGSASQDPFTMGATGVKIGYGIMNGQTPADRTVLMAPKLVTRDNVDNYIGWTQH